MASSIARTAITGLILAGGEGRRMGGVDKGLQIYRGKPLVEHAIDKLQRQGLKNLMVSANRNLNAYARYGFPVLQDLTPGHQGPLAGILTGLQHARSPWVLVVPCDVPNFPDDLLERLLASISEPDVSLSMAQSHSVLESRVHPVFCLVQAALKTDLKHYLDAGHRRVMQWMLSQPHALCDFHSPIGALQAFENFNTPESLRNGLENGDLPPDQSLHRR